jgi:ABC-type uncharacterized transport system permease subunit
MNRNLFAGTLQFLITALAVAMVVIIILLPFALSQPEPGAVFAGFLIGPFGTLRHLGNIAEIATPIALTGLAATIIFRSGLFNLGMEGGFFLGGLAATAAALLLPLPGFAAPLVSVAIGALVGSFACTLPGYLRLRHDAPEMVTSLVLNYALLFGGVFVLNYVLRDPAAGSLMSFRIPADARLERLLPGTRLNSGAIVAVLACLAGGIWLYRTRSGLNLRIVGLSAGFSAHLGLDHGRIVMKAQLIGGLIAGMAGAIEVLGLYPRFSWTALPGLGWTGIVVAILARENPFLILPAALFLGYLQVGGNLLSQNTDIPSEVVGLVTAAIMLVVTATAIFDHPALLRLIRTIRHGEVRPS